jgi:hypothetical protein
MKEYIERGALIKKMFPIGLVDDGRYALPAKAVKTAIDNAPAADVVEVVRCRDCQFAYIDGDRAYCRNINTPWYNDYFEIFTNANDFCSYGERKEK